MFSLSDWPSTDLPSLCCLAVTPQLSLLYSEVNLLSPSCCNSLETYNNTVFLTWCQLGPAGPQSPQVAGLLGLPHSGAGLSLFCCWVRAALICLYFSAFSCVSLTSGPYNSNTKGIGQVLSLGFASNAEEKTHSLPPWSMGHTASSLCTLKRGGLANSSRTGFGAAASASLA